MDKKEIIQLAHEVFKPLGYKKRNCNWSKETPVVIKIFNLQKSMYGDLYYLNIGFIIKGLELNGTYDHLNTRFYYKDHEQEEYLSKLLDFDSEISDESRKEGLKQTFYDLSDLLEHIYTMDDLLDFIDSYYVVPMSNKVCQYLGIPDKW